MVQRNRLLTLHYYYIRQTVFLLFLLASCYMTAQNEQIIKDLNHFSRFESKCNEGGEFNSSINNFLGKEGFCNLPLKESNSGYNSNTSTLVATTTLINLGSSWSYYDNANEPAVQGSLDWNDNAYDASNWASGNTHMGYGDGDEVTTVNNATKTLYVRHSFNVNDPSIYGDLILNLTYDDGAVVYLNGDEVWRVNMPTGSITYSTYAASTSTDNAMASEVLANILQTGNNVIAVEIHQRSATSSDISFDFELEANDPGTVLILRGPYLQKGTPSSVVVRWRTLVATESIVYYGTSLGNLTQTASNPGTATEHEIEITNLDPETKYYYEIANNAGVYLPEASDQFFRTHPNAGTVQPYTFWILGDAGTANNNQRAVRDAYYNYIGANETDGILFLGDNAYNDGTDNEYQFAIFENMYEDKLKNSIAWSTLGNHDGHSANSNNQSGPYYDIFTFPKAGESGGMASGTEAYYSFDYGNIHFIVLESYETDRSVGGAMYNWAESDVQNTSQEWIVAFWHHPAYSKGSHDSDTEGNLINMRENFLPMLENNGVDLVLSGHSHSYERSYFINGHYGHSDSFDSGTMTVGATGNGSGKVDDTGAYVKSNGSPDGAVYITAGSSGKISGGSLDHEAMYFSISALGSCVLEVDGSTLHVKFLRETGAVDDYFTIEKEALCTIGGSCDDGDDCTENDIYDSNCDCAGSPLPDSDGDGICDDLDVCPGFDDTIDTDGDGVPDGCDICAGSDDNVDTDGDGVPDGCDICAGSDDNVDTDGDGVPDGCDICAGFDDNLDSDGDGIPDGCDNSICMDNTTNFNANPLTHSGAGSSSTNIIFEDGSQDISFTISDIGQKLNGNPDRRYIDLVDVNYLDASGLSQYYGTFSGANLNSVNINIPEEIQEITVTLSDGLDGSSASTLSIQFSVIDYCIDSTPCTPDSDGDGVCDAEDQCPGLDDALIGTSCDDGDGCTSNDVYDTNCYCVGNYTDDDGDGYCIGDDPDDNDGCNPDPNSSACNPCEQIISDGFENSFGNWNDGGNDAARVATNANSGSYSVRLRDNSGQASSIFTNNLDLSTYNEVWLSFSALPNSMENGEDFLLELSTDGGSSYSILQSWISGIHFTNGFRINEDVQISGPFNSNVRFRFRCDASANNDQVYLDDIEINSCNPASLVAMSVSSNAKTLSQLKQSTIGEEQIKKDLSDEASLTESIKVFPNPARQELKILFEGHAGQLARINLYGLQGQLIKQELIQSSKQEFILRLDDVHDGIYFFIMQNDEGLPIFIQKVMIKNN